MISLTGRPPTGTYDLIVVSPHMDDAVYSVGGRIAQARRQGRRVLVVTLFGPGTGGQAAKSGSEAPKPAPARRTDVVSDVKASISDYAARCDEERAGLNALDVDSAWLDEPELIFRKHSVSEIVRMMMPVWSMPWSPVHEALVNALEALCQAHLGKAGSITFPLAVGFHPDHRVACDVGRALLARGAHVVEFYEDIPYTHARPLRALRMRTLGMSAKLSVVAGTRDLTRVLFRDSRSLRWGSYLPLASYIVLLAVLQRVFGLRDLAPNEAAPHRAEHDIADAVATKVTAMKLYPSQTRMFFGEGEAIYDELRREGGYAEHSWKFR